MSQVQMKTSPATTATTASNQEKSRGLNTEEAKKLSFWISQIFIIAATVLGVYLASSQGFKQALAYEGIQSDKNNYYLRKSLQNELTDNLVLVKDYMDKIEKGSIADRKSAFRLDTFVWESMKYSSATLETPSDLLKESRRFYREVNDIHQRVVSNDYGVKQAVKLLQALVDNMEQNVLPKFETDTAALKTKLAQFEVIVD